MGRRDGRLVASCNRAPSHTPSGPNSPLTPSPLYDSSGTTSSSSAKSSGGGGGAVPSVGGGGARIRIYRRSTLSRRRRPTAAPRSAAARAPSRRGPRRPPSRRPPDPCTPTTWAPSRAARAPEQRERRAMVSWARGPGREQARAHRLVVVLVPRRGLLQPQVSRRVAVRQPAAALLVRELG